MRPGSAAYDFRTRSVWARTTSTTLLFLPLPCAPTVAFPSYIVCTPRLAGWADNVRHFADAQTTPPGGPRRGGARGAGPPGCPPPPPQRKPRLADHAEGEPASACIFDQPRSALSWSRLRDGGRTGVCDPPARHVAGPTLAGAAAGALVRLPAT